MGQFIGHYLTLLAVNRIFRQVLFCIQHTINYWAVSTGHDAGLIEAKSADKLR